MSSNNKIVFAPNRSDISWFLSFLYDFMSLPIKPTNIGLLCLYTTAPPQDLDILWRAGWAVNVVLFAMLVQWSGTWTKSTNQGQLRPRAEKHMMKTVRRLLLHLIKVSGDRLFNMLRKRTCANNCLINPKHGVLQPCSKNNLGRHKSKSALF